MAEIDLTTSPATGAITVQSESIIAATGTEVTGDLDIRTNIGAGFSVNEKVYVRYDLVNATFSENLSGVVTVTDDTAGQFENVVVSQGGLAGDSWVVYSGTIDTGGIEQTNDLLFDLSSSSIIVDDQNDVTVIYGLYESLSAAANGNNSVAEDSGTVLTFGSAIAVAVSAVTDPASVVAEVENDFLDFGAAGDTVEIGSVTFTETGADHPDFVPGTLTGFEIYAATSTLTVMGDFQLGIDADGGAGGTAIYDTDSVFLGDGGCGAAVRSATSVTEDTAVLSVDLDGDGVGTYAICLEAQGDEEILAGSYSAQFDGVSADATEYTARTGISGALGSITRNGVVVQLPYLTTFEGYNQRIIIVNRNSVDIVIAGITFTPEDGNTVTSLMTADDMMIGANKTKILLVRDIIQIDGDRTRTAATLSVVAKAGSIDVATQQVSVDGGPTDTVEYTAN